MNQLRDKSQNNKRLAKNTIILYIRTIFVLIISLYTSRVVLDVLGIDDYGIYNLIGGFVSMFAIVSQTMVASSQRFLTFELGKISNNHSREVFSTSLIVHIGLSIVVMLLFESIGLWFLNNKLNIDPSRNFAANYIYQFSVITFILQLIRAPYEATVIAHERMSMFAYLNISEAILKLLILYLISLCTLDSLIQYGFYLMSISIISFSVYYIYCKRNFSEVSFKIVLEKAYYTSIFKFAGYNFLGSISSILSNQGLSILLNIYFGVAVNAAKGIANQVHAAISKFVSDFTVALNPQITKAYALGDIDYTMSLVYKGARYSFYLFLILGLPICIETPYILTLWLKQVPEYTVVFIRWTLATSIINTFANSVSTCAMATGDIKKLSIWLGSVRLLVLPIAYVCFECNLPAYFAYVITFASTFILVFIRLIIVCKQLQVSSSFFIKEVILNCSFVGVLSLAWGCMLHYFLFCNINLIQLIVEFILMTIGTGGFILLLGMSKEERQSLLILVKNKISI